MRFFGVDSSVIPWSPVARGSLAKPRSDNSSIRAETDQYIKHLASNDDPEHEIIDRVEALAKKKQISMAQVATAWILSKDGSYFFDKPDISYYCSNRGIEFGSKDQGDGGSYQHSAHGGGD